MKKLATIVVAGCALGLSAQHACAQGGNALRQGEAGQGLGGATGGEAPVSRPFLQGDWEGVLTAVGPEADGSPSILPPFQAARGQVGFRLAIGETNLVMYFQNGSDWVALGEGQDLRLNQAGRSSIVITALPATENSIETMMLNIMRWEEDAILVHMSRVTGADEKAGTGPGVVNLMGLLGRSSGR